MLEALQGHARAEVDRLHGRIFAEHTLVADAEQRASFLRLELAAVRERQDRHAATGDIVGMIESRHRATHVAGEIRRLEALSKQGVAAARGLRHELENLGVSV